ncbi:MAG: hypothetical protein JRJ87_11605 [Deltaproteobacteria bacterium]|nr:hypothetical protein [Deltaproteobacteria bacterium]
MRKFFAATLCITVLLVVGCAAVDVVPEQSRSTHFLPTAKHLDLGGTVFLYVDLSGDMERITAFVAQVLDEIKKENPDPDLAKIDVPKLVGLLGFNQLQAVGLSSVRVGELYHNKGFAYHPAAKQGFMRLLGDKARPFETPNWAPADADLVFEQDYNLHGAFQVIEAMIRDVMGAEAGALLAELNQALPKMHVTPRQIIEKLDSRIVGVVRIHESEMIRVPGEDLEFPYTEMALGVDGLGFVFDDLVESLGGLPMVKVTAAEDFHSIEAAQPLPGQLAIYKPVLAKDVKTGRVYLATSLKLLREFVPGPKALGKSKVFAQASLGLPKAGNGLTFVSDKFVGKVMTYLTYLGQKNDELKSMIGLVEALMPPRDVALAGCNGMLPDGMFFVSNSNSSHKVTLLTLAYANPWMLGILAAVTIPSFIGYQDSAMEVMEAQQLQKAREMAEEAKPVVAPPE